METTEDHLRYLEGSVAVLEDYLLSSEVFWSSGATAAESGMELPKLTIGGVLLALAQAKAGVKSAEQQRRLQLVQKQIEAVRTKWRVAWGKKCQRSFHRRLFMWRDYLDEFRAEPNENADRYPHEVRLRVMLHLLQKEVPSIEEAELGLLLVLDKILRQVLRPGDFVWDAGLVGGFPSGEYWFLYGRLPRNLS